MWKTFTFRSSFISVNNYARMIFHDDSSNLLSHYKQCYRHLSDKTNAVPAFNRRPPPSYKFSVPNPDDAKPKQKIGVGKFLLLSVPILTFGLGTWQVKRREWKLKLIEDLASKMKEPEIELPDDLNELSSLEYRKIRVKGKFDHSTEMYFGPRSLLNEKGESANISGLISVPGRTVVGHHIITPFILSDSGQRILIDRGWVPTNLLAVEKRQAGQIKDEVEIIGTVRLQESRGTFVPPNKPHLKIYHYRDIKKMSKKANTLPVLLDANAESTVPSGPVGGQTNVSIRNEHMSYIITWYCLSAVTLGMWCMKFL